MKVIVEIELDSSWDEYKHCSREIFESDLLEQLSKDGIISAKIADVIDEQSKDK